MSSASLQPILISKPAIFFMLSFQEQSYCQHYPGQMKPFSSKHVLPQLRIYLFSSEFGLSPKLYLRTGTCHTQLYKFSNSHLALTFF